VLCQLSYAHHGVSGDLKRESSILFWRAWPDLNGRHTAPEAVALSGLSYRRESLTCTIFGIGQLALTSFDSCHLHGAKDQWCETDQSHPDG
jgi:hypothetical protein